MGRPAIAERLKALLARRPDSADVLLAGFAILVGWALLDIGVFWVKLWAGACCLGIALLRSVARSKPNRTG